MRFVLHKLGLQDLGLPSSWGLMYKRVLGDVSDRIGHFSRFVDPMLIMVVVLLVMVYIYHSECVSVLDHRLVP